jgi:hypothetical protein
MLLNHSAEHWDLPKTRMFYSKDVSPVTDMDKFEIGHDTFFLVYRFPFKFYL